MSRRTWAVVAGLVAAIAIVAAVLVVTSSDDGDGDDRRSTTTTTSTSTTSTTVAPSSTTTTTAVPAGAALWPAAGSSVRYSSPEDAARSFATDFLRFERPVVETFRAGDARSGEVPIRPSASGPVTTILVRQLSGTDWSVIGATTERIEVATPPAGQAIASPVRVTGRAHAFEGNVEVSVRADGRAEPIGQGFVTGGGDAMAPFEGSIAFTAPAARFGTLVFFTTSAENGQVWEATVVRVAFG
jgi:hypothetical protein